MQVKAHIISFIYLMLDLINKQILRNNTFFKIYILYKLAYKANKHIKNYDKKVKKKQNYDTNHNPASLSLSLSLSW